MKIFFTLLAAVTLLSTNMYSQLTLIYEDFSTYDGTSSTVPAGWTFSSNDNYQSSFINSGCDSTAYKFGANNATITTPSFSGADSVSFWLKGTSGIDASNFLTVYETEDNVVWDTIAKIIPVPTTGIIKKYAVKNTSVNLKFIYSKPGSGNAAFDCFLLTGPEAISANFSAPDVCIGDSTCFTDLSSTMLGTITSWEWDFGDGGSATLTNPCHLYSAAGNYSVQLIVTNSNSEKDTIVKTVSVGVYPIADFSAENNCLNDTAFFTDSSSIVSGTIASWNWDFGNGDSSSMQNPIHLYSSAGAYSVELTVTSDLGCVDTNINSITIYDLPLIDTSAMVITNPNCGASDGSISGISVNGNSPFTYLWIPDLQTTLDLTNAASGNYSFEVIDSNNCSSSENFILVSTSAPPAPTLSDTSVSYCENDSIEALSVTGTGGTITWYDDSALTSIVANGGMYTPVLNLGENIFYVTETSVEGCESPAASVILTLNQNPVADFGVGIIPEGGLEIGFYDISTGAISWFWDFGDGGTDTAQNISHSYDTAGTYMVTLTVTSVNGCSDDTAMSVTATTFIEENLFSNSIFISPNPSNGKFLIQRTTNNEQRATIKISNILGEIIFVSELRTTNSELDLTNQSEGAYFVTITKGEKVATKKIVIIK